MRKILFIILLLPLSVWGKPDARHELGVFSGPFLIAQADQIMSSVGGRFSYAVNSNHVNHLELRAFGSNEGGVSYYIGELSIRNEFKVNRISAVWLLGLDYHYFRSRSSSVYTNKSSWHAGVGINLDINDNLMFRNDYIVRFSNGISFSDMSLLVTMGLAWAFGD